MARQTKAAPAKKSTKAAAKTMKTYTYDVYADSGAPTPVEAYAFELDERGNLLFHGTNGVEAVFAAGHWQRLQKVPSAPPATAPAAA